MDHYPNRFTKCLNLLANPQYYDYFHYLKLDADGTACIDHGDGQAMKFEVSARYRLSWDDPNHFKIEFYDVIIGEMYRGDDDGHCPNFRLPCRVEHGAYGFRRDCPGRIEDESKWPCLLYTKRYHFDRDPLALGEPVGSFEGRPTGSDDENGIDWYYYDNDDRVFCNLDEIEELAAKTGMKLQWPEGDA
jgi:YD repeat-containing protein